MIVLVLHFWSTEASHKVGFHLSSWQAASECVIMLFMSFLASPFCFLPVAAGLCGCINERSKLFMDNRLFNVGGRGALHSPEWCSGNGVSLATEKKQAFPEHL